MSARTIQVRPSRNPRWQKRGGWEVFEAEGVCPVWCGETGRQNALDYAQQRAHSGLCDVQVSTTLGMSLKLSAMKSQNR